MRMEIDKPGGHNLPRCIDGFCTLSAVQIAQSGDLAVLDTDICHPCSAARTIYNLSTLDHRIERHPAASLLIYFLYLISIYLFKMIIYKFFCQTFMGNSPLG